ncbi:class I SAM-dependent methyltransferase [Chloroflexota bacterium]
MFDGAATEAEFKNTGEGFTRHFLIEHARLQPHEKVLDVGSGVGQKARVLTRYLSSEGTYEGFDIVDAGVTWCKERYQRYPNFHFQLADIYSKHFNSGGKYKGSEYRFPYEDEAFDLVFLSSVFTHMLPQDVEHYLTEITRVLKEGGRCVITFFLLNPEAQRRMDAELNTIEVPFELDPGRCRIADPDTPEAIVAYDEQYIRGLYDMNGLSVTEITYGFWCGRREIWSCLQDVIIAVRE